MLDVVIVPIIPQSVPRDAPAWLLWTIIGLYTGALAVGALAWVWMVVSDRRTRRRRW